MEDLRNDFPDLRLGEGAVVDEIGKGLAGKELEDEVHGVVSLDGLGDRRGRGVRRCI